MKHYRPEATDHRSGSTEQLMRKLGTNAHRARLPAGFPHREPRAPRVQDHPLRSALELRYQVYCVECGFLSPHDYPDGIETDEHDKAAAHFYAFDAKSEMVGYVRLVRPDVDQRFPFQQHCITSDGEVTLPKPGHAAEISRLMVHHDYRRLRADRTETAPTERRKSVVAGDKRHRASHILLSLYRQMYAFSRANGIGHWYAAMERPLARSLQRLNLAFKSIGPQTDYYGPVAPYLASLHDLEAHMGARNPALLAWLQQA